MNKVLVLMGWLAVGWVVELLVLVGAAGFLLALLVAGVPLAGLWASLLAVAATVLLVVWMMAWRDRLAAQGLLW